MGPEREVGKVRHASRSKKLANYVFIPTQEAESVNRKWEAAINPCSSPFPIGILSPPKLYLLKGP